jgi:uncharacterized membrane protein
MKRIESIDITRGLVMVIMALDHVRDFMHTTSMSHDPVNLQTTTPLLFMTRWVTHLCAPAFVFLSGISVYLSLKRTNNTQEARKFLLTRGFWLIFLEFTVINFALWFDIHFRFVILEVIGAIGISFIILSFMLKVPSRIIGLIGIVIIFGHNLLQGISISQNPAAIFFSSVLFRPALMPITSGLSFFTAYPVIPWLGIMLAGFACGEFFELSPEKRKIVFLKLGGTALSLFIIIRLLNFYGDPAKWTEQKSSVFTLLSFLNTTKYPPSLLFTLLFTGLVFLFLSIFEKAGNRFTGILSVFGKVPLFYFIVHLYIIHAVMFVMLYIQGFSTNDFLFGMFNNGRPKTGGGVELYIVYLIWIGVVLLLYPACKWYSDYKEKHRENKFLRYL